MTRLLLLLLLVTPAWAEPPTLAEAYTREHAELTATRDALRGELKALEARHTRQRRGLSRDVDRLEAELRGLRAQLVEARGAARLAESRAAGDADRDGLLTSTLQVAGRALEKLGQPQPPEGAPPERLRAAVAAVAAQVPILSRVRVEPGAFFGADGRRVEGRVIHLGRVAHWGLADGQGGALGPGPDGTLKVIEAGEGPIEAWLAGRDHVPAFAYDPASPAERPPAEKTLQDLIDAAGVIGWVILLLGGLMLLISLERAIALTLAGAGRAATRRVCAALQRSDLSEARAAAEGPGALRRVLRGLLAEPDESHAHLDEVAARAVFRELPRLERLLPLLRTIAAVAPLLGLLGTVTGMIATFDVITEYGTGDPKRLSGGISQALVTTELGLAVAIPTLLLHTLLNRWADRILARLQTDSMVVIHDLACHRDPDHPHAHAHCDHGHH